MGFGQEDLRKSSRIRDRANRIRAYHPYSARRLPYHKLICTFGAFDNIHPVGTDISLPRVNHTKQPVPDMAEDARFDTLETDVGNLKTDMREINEKLDKLLLAMAEKPPATRDAVDIDDTDTITTAPEAAPLGKTQPTKGSHTHPSATSGSTIPPRPAHKKRVPDNVSREVSMEEYVHREMEKDSFHYNPAGKTSFVNDINSARIMSKPYMFMYREGVHTIKQKLENRHSMTPMEYVDATMALLADTRAYDPLDYHDIMFHLRKVSRDSLERQWPAVRRWSQHIWDEVESGNMTWADRDLIQDERIRICLTAAPQNASVQPSNYRSRNVQESLCRSFNSRQGCHHRESHMEGNTWSLHCCSYCDSVGKICSHSVRECERRITHSRPFDTNHQFNRRQNSQLFQYQQHPMQHNPGFQSASNQQGYQSKNGF